MGRLSVRVVAEQLEGFPERRFKFHSDPLSRLVHGVGSTVGGAVGLGFAEDDPRNPNFGTPGHPGFVEPPPEPPPPPPPPVALPAPVAAPPPPAVTPSPTAATDTTAAMADAAAQQRVRRGRAGLTMTSPAGLLGGPGSAYANQSTNTLLG